MSHSPDDKKKDDDQGWYRWDDETRRTVPPDVKLTDRLHALFADGMPVFRAHVDRYEKLMQQMPDQRDLVVKAFHLKLYIDILEDGREFNPSLRGSILKHDIEGNEADDRNTLRKLYANAGIQKVKSAASAALAVYCGFCRSEFLVSNEMRKLIRCMERLDQLWSKRYDCNSFYDEDEVRALLVNAGEIKTLVKQRNQQLQLERLEKKRRDDEEKAKRAADEANRLFELRMAAEEAERQAEQIYAAPATTTPKPAPANPAAGHQKVHPIVSAPAGQAKPADGHQKVHSIVPAPDQPLREAAFDASSARPPKEAAVTPISSRVAATERHVIHLESNAPVVLLHGFMTALRAGDSPALLRSLESLRHFGMTAELCRIAVEDGDEVEKPVSYWTSK